MCTLTELTFLIRHVQHADQRISRWSNCSVLPGIAGAPELVVGAAAIGDDLHAIERQRDVRRVGREELLTGLRRQCGVLQRQY
jgi:hypothetical protein